MTRNDFDEFIHNHKLYGFDGLIAVTLADGSTHRAVWLTTLPELLPSVDGSFAGKAEILAFYIMDCQQYVCWELTQIEKIECIQEQYLK